jgi:hypothetical protein
VTVDVVDLDDADGAGDVEEAEGLGDAAGVGVAALLSSPPSPPEPDPAPAVGVGVGALPTDPLTGPPTGGAAASGPEVDVWYPNIRTTADTVPRRKKTMRFTELTT